MKRLLLVCLSFLLLAAQGRAQGRVVEESFQRDPGPLDFIRGDGFEQAILQALTGDALVGLDVRGNPVPRLALSWLSKNQTLRFRLRNDAVFSDGTPVQAEDVVWTYQNLQSSPEANPTKKAILEGVKASVSGADVLITSSKPADRLLRELGRIPVTRRGNGSVGSGPFACEKRNGEWFFNARPHFLRPRITAFHFRLIPDENGQLDALQ